LKTGWVWGCLYLAAYAGWAWLFRSTVDSWARRRLGHWLGVDVIWLRATTFPLEIWVWGLAGRDSLREDSRLGSRVLLGSLALCLAAAFTPTAGLCLVLRCSSRASGELGAALYLTTPLLLLLFVASHLRRRASEPGGGGGEVGEAGRRSTGGPSEPPGRLDPERES
jgi:hypothetical protein